jgi:hypothetical protein
MVIFSPQNVKNYVDKLIKEKNVPFGGMISGKVTEVIADLNLQGIFLCQIDDDPFLLAQVRQAHQQQQNAVLRKG